jgi:PAS domain S-box-containing protein
MVFPEDMGIAVPHMAKVLSGEPDACELRFVTRSGEVRWVRDYARPVRDGPDGRIVGIHGAAQDVTGRVRAEQSLRESEASLARAQALTQLGSWEVDLATNRGTWSAQMYRIFGVDPALPPPTMQEFLDMLHPDDRREFMRAHNHAARAGTSIDLEFRSNPCAGKIRWFHARAQAIRDVQGRIVRLVGTTQDISERKRAEEKIRQSNRRLRQLSQRLVQVQESERRQLARELHDEVGQLLTGLRFMLVRCRRGPAPAECLEDAATVVDDLIQKVRNLSLDLRPAMLDDLGLLPTLHWHLDRFMNQTGIKVAVKHDSELEERRFHADVETSAYRIIQEALTNVARHAGVTEATLRVEADDRRLCIEVEDRGVGFDPAALLGGYTNGLSGMRERAELLGGELILTTKVGVGTRVSAVLPLAEQHGSPVSEPEVVR